MELQDAPRCTGRMSGAMLCQERMGVVQIFEVNLQELEQDIVTIRELLNETNEGVEYLPR